MNRRVNVHLTAKMSQVSLFLILFIAAGCGAHRQAGWDRQVDQQDGDTQQIIEQADAHWAKRSSQVELENALKQYERAVATAPDRDVMIRLARGYYFLSDAYYGGNKEAQLKYFDLAASWGERAMATHPEFVKQVQEMDAAVEDAITVLDEDYVGAVYWSAAAIGKWARLKGFATLISKKNIVKKFMEWVTETSPEYYHAGPQRYWGAYYAIAPSFAGGDLAKAKIAFEKSLTQAPNFLGTKVLMADTYATKVQDRELYERLLNEVLAADIEAIEGVMPEQASEQAKAKKLLALSDDRFAKADSDLNQLALRQK